MFYFFSFPSFLVILGARPSKRKSRDSDSNNNRRRWKKAKARSTVPSGTQVIDLVGDIPAGSIASQSTVSSALHPPATFQSPPSAPIISPSSCLTQQVLSTPAIVPIITAAADTAQVLSPPTSPTHQFEAFPTSTCMPIHSDTPTLPPNSSSPSSLSSPPMPSDKTPPSQAVADENSTTTTSTSLVVSSPPAMDTAVGEQGQRVQACQVNYWSQTAHQSSTDQ